MGQVIKLNALGELKRAALVATFQVMDHAKDAHRDILGGDLQTASDELAAIDDWLTTAKMEVAAAIQLRDAMNENAIAAHQTEGK